MKNISKKFLIITTLLFTQSLQANEICLRTLGKNTLKLSDKVELTIEKFEREKHEDYRTWKSKLVVKENGKVIIEKFPILDSPNEAMSLYFVPIVDGKYLKDLDFNADLEFAVALDHEGNAPGAIAHVFTLKGSKLSLYQKAWYHMEGKSGVIWDYNDVPEKVRWNERGENI